MNRKPAYPQVRFVTLLLISLLPSIAAAQVPQFDAFYVFGDSLADNGNILIQTTLMRMQPPAPPSATPHLTYFEGRFSNGYIGFEYLWQRLSGHAPGTPQAMKPSLSAPFILRPGALDFAFGGTGTPYVDKTPGGFSSPGLKGQVELFRLALLGRKPSSRALYGIATGANDYRNDPFNVPMNPVDVASNIEDAIVSLYKLGARNVILLDLPDLGKIPANAGPASGGATAISTAHNVALYAAVARLQARYAQLHLILVKLDPLFEDLHTRFGQNAPVPMIAVFSPNPANVSCLFVDPVTCTDMPLTTFKSTLPFLFWDVVHPTTEAHRFLGDYMYDQLTDEYE